MDFGIYLINFALFIFKDEMPEKIIAYGKNDETGSDRYVAPDLEFCPILNLFKIGRLIQNRTKFQIGVNRYANITLEFSKGRKAFLVYSSEDIMPNSAFISCTDGHFLIPEFFHCPTRLIRVKGRQKVGENSAEGIEFPLEDNAYYIYNNSSGLRYEADHVYECVRQGLKESRMISFETSEKLAEIVQEIRRQLGLVLHQDRHTNYESA